MAVKMKKVVACGSRREKAVSRKLETAKPPKAKKSSPFEIEQLILSHRENGRKLARSMLSKWHVRMPADEVDSVVDLTLCEVAQRFDATKGASFMTFFFYHLRGHLVRTVTEAAQSSNIFLAFAEKTGIDTKEWNAESEKAFLAYMPDHLSYHGIDDESPEELYLRKERITVCRVSCASLDALELEVLERSYVNDESLISVSRNLGYSRCHISRVKKRALEKMKKNLQEVSGEAFVPENKIQHLREAQPCVRSAKKTRNRKRRELSKELCVGESKRMLRVA